MDIIVDIDGTLADCSHRKHYIETKPKNYEAFYLALSQDRVIEPVARVVRDLYYAKHRIILCSGRPENYRDLTHRWMTLNNIEYHYLYMRSSRDFRADDVIKSELLDQILADGFLPSLVFDDRKRVVDMWRRRGLICAQVAEGDF